MTETTAASTPTAPTEEPRLCMVTGANGFIGSRLVEKLLEAGHSVRITCRETSDLKWLKDVDGKYEKHFADLTDRSALETAVAGCHWVFHLAGMTSAPDWATFERVNQEGTANIFAAAQTAAKDTLQRFIYLSSMSAGGPADTSRAPKKEDTENKPVSQYGTSKLGGETRIAELAKADSSREWPWTVMRPPAVYGPRDKDIFEFFKFIKMCIKPSFGYPAMWTSIVHVDDLVDAMLAVTRADDKQVTGEVFNVCNTDYHHIWSLMGAIQKHMRRPVTFPLWMPLWLLYIYAKVVGGLAGMLGIHFPLTIDKWRDIRGRYWIADVSKIRERTGWSARIPIDTGLGEARDWYYENKWL